MAPASDSPDPPMKSDSRVRYFIYKPHWGAAKAANLREPHSIPLRSCAHSTGSEQPSSHPIPIKDGKIEGNAISYTATFDFGEPFLQSYKGIVSPDQIKMSVVDPSGMPDEFVLKREKAAFNRI
jgi:hypothetical protein